MTKSLVEMAAEIVQSQSSSVSMTTEEIGFALQNTFKTLQDLHGVEGKMTAEGTGDLQSTGVDIAPEKSILKNKIICLECGQEFKMLSPKHLASHGLTGRQYREKYGLKLRQPLCAKALSANRKKAGKERGIPENLKKAIAARKKKASTAAAAPKAKRGRKAKTKAAK